MLRQPLAARDPGGRLAAGALWQEHGLVFVPAIGTPLDAANVRREFREITEAAGLGTGWAPRDLRHTFVSLMSADAGLPGTGTTARSGYEDLFAERTVVSLSGPGRCGRPRSWTWCCQACDRAASRQERRSAGHRGRSRASHRRHGRSRAHRGGAGRRWRRPRPVPPWAFSVLRYLEQVAASGKYPLATRMFIEAEDFPDPDGVFEWQLSRVLAPSGYSADRGETGREESFVPYREVPWAPGILPVLGFATGTCRLPP